MTHDLKGQKKLQKKSIWRGALWLSIGSFISKLIGALYRIFLPRVLGDYGVGLFQMAYPLYAVLLAVSVNGIPIALSKQTAERLSKNDIEGAENLASWAQVVLGIIGVILAVLMGISSPWIANHVFSEPQAEWSIRALAPALAFVALESGFRGYFQGHQEMLPTAVSQILEQVVRVSVMFPLALGVLSYGVPYAAAAATLGAPIGAMAGVLVLIVWRKPYRKRHLIRPIPIRDILSLFWVALPVSLSGLLFPIMFLADSMFVPQRLRLTGMTMRAATAQFGQLSGEAMPLVNLTMVIGAALAVTLVPAVAQAMASGERQTAGRRVDTAVHMIWVMGLPMTAGLIILAVPLTKVLYGESGAAASLQVLAFGSCVLAIQQVIGSSLQASGYGWLPVKNLAIGATLKFGLTWWLTPLPHFGIRGAAIGTIGAAMVTAYLNWRDWQKVAQYQGHLFREGLWALLATVIMTMGLEVWMRLGVIGLSLTVKTLGAIVLGIVIYGAVIVLTGEGRDVLQLLRER